VKSRVFLIVCAIGLVPLALVYGANPSVSLEILFGITVDNTNLTHIMRAVMGLYVSMVVLWLWGAFSKPMTGPALVSCATFMLGLAGGRALSLVLDGMPSWILVGNGVLELILGAIAVALYRAHVSTGANAS
jgi:hypothetical protein